MSGNEPWPALTLASMNIERSTRLSRVRSFMAELGFDVVCLQ
jgi:hypothetical protein